LRNTTVYDNGHFNYANQTGGSKRNGVTGCYSTLNVCRIEIARIRRLLSLLSRMDHAELVLEMSHLERMPTADRLALARRRRVQQLRLWAQKDRERRRSSPPRNNRHIYFSDNVMLLEAASRNDIEEGMT